MPPETKPGGRLARLATAGALALAIGFFGAAVAAGMAAERVRALAGRGDGL
jgi:hypothetical protein